MLPPTPLNIWYKDPDGFLWYLSDRTMMYAKYPNYNVPNNPCQGGFCCSAISGIEGLPVAMQTLPMLDGISLPLTYLPQTGTIGIAIIVTRPATGKEEDYYDLLDKIVRAFYNRRTSVPAPGILYIQRPGSPTTRQIEVFTTTGLNTPDVGLNDVSVYTLALATPDPYWSDQNPNTITLDGIFQNSGILPVDFTSTGKGIAFNSSVEAGVYNFQNYGDSQTYPEWIITGPGTPTIKNLTTGLSWGLNQSIPIGQQVQVTTAPGKQTCVNLSTNPPTNIWNQLVFGGPHTLWALMAGNNSVSISIPDATAVTKISVGYSNRYIRA